jgi:hypothetical protein
MIVFAVRDRREVTFDIQDVEHQSGERGCVRARCPREIVVAEAVDQRGEIEVTVVCRAHHRSDHGRGIKWLSKPIHRSSLARRDVTPTPDPRFSRGARARADGRIAGTHHRSVPRIPRIRSVDTG